MVTRGSQAGTASTCTPCSSPLLRRAGTWTALTPYDCLTSCQWHPREHDSGTLDDLLQEWVLLQSKAGAGLDELAHENRFVCRSQTLLLEKACPTVSSPPAAGCLRLTSLSKPVRLRWHLQDNSSPPTRSPPKAPPESREEPKAGLKRRTRGSITQR